MQQRTMEMLVEAGESCGVEITAYPDYSGRGMYGKRTCGVTFNSLGDLLAATVVAAQGLEGDEFHEMLHDMKRINTDSMGMDKIAY